MENSVNDMTYEDQLEAIRKYGSSLIELSKDMEPYIVEQIMVELEQLLNYAQNNLKVYTLELGLNFHRGK